MGIVVITLEDLVNYKQYVLDTSLNIYDFIGWEYPSGEVIILYPWVKSFASRKEAQQVTPPGVQLRLQWMINYNGVSKDYMIQGFGRRWKSKKFWWQFWK